jgi:lia operon protein LiaG
MKKTILGLAFAMIFAGLVIFGIAFAVSGFSLKKFSMVKFTTNTYTVDEDFSDIQITTGTYDFVFKPSDDGKVKLVCYEPEKNKTTANVENNKLVIKTDEKKLKWFEQISFIGESSRVTVYLPAKEYAAINAKASTGDITIPSDFSFESVDITESTGDVNCTASAAGRIYVKTSTGDVTLKDVKAGSLEITVSTGEITMSDVIISGDMNLNSSTGDIEFTDCDAANIYAKTSTGEITGSLLSGKSFSAKSSTGDIKIPDSSGDGGKCELKTSTGDINIRLS